MRVLIFGTYFYRFEDIVEAVLQGLAQKFGVSVKVELLMDCESDLIHFRRLELNKHFVDWNSKTEPINTFDLIKEQIFELFWCDQDRHEEYQLRPPSVNALKKDIKRIHKCLEDLDASNFDLFICEGGNNFFNRVILHSLGNTNGPRLCFTSGRVGPSSFITVTANGVTGYLTNPRNAVLLGQQDESVPTYMSASHPNHRGLWSKMQHIRDTSLWRDIRAAGYGYRGGHGRPHYKIDRFFLIVYTRFIEVRSSLLRPYVTWKCKNLGAPKNTKYVVYPEHFRPEASVSARDFSLRNDVENVSKILSQLPSDIELVYRFHPSYFCKRKIQSLWALLATKNINFSMPWEPLDRLIENSEGVVTVSSTVGLDALRLGKRTIVTGTPEYKEASAEWFLSQSIDRINLDRLSEDPSENHSAILEQVKQFYFPCEIYSQDWVIEAVDRFGLE